MYPLLTRGNRRDQIFLQDVDRHDFMKTLAEACQQTGWPVHAYCLTPNHHRLVAETPEPDLVSGQRGCDLKADIVVTGLPAASEPLGEDLLDAVQPRVIIVADSDFPASARATPKLRERFDQRNVPVLYTCSDGAATLELGRGRWKITPMSGVRLTSRSSVVCPK